MRAVIGVDRDSVYAITLEVLARLRPAPLEVNLAHVDEPVVLTYGSGFYPYFEEVPEATQAAQEEAAQILLDEAEAKSNSLGVRCDRTYAVMDTPTRFLKEHADEVHADLIGVGATLKPKYEHFFLGGVGRGLVMGAHQSVLIGKKTVAPEGPLKVVFATDHSEYSNRCIQQFLAWNVQGVGHLTVLTALGHPDRSDPAFDVLRNDFAKTVEARTQEIADRFVADGIQAEAKVATEEVQTAIRNCCEAVEPDLLVVGARGHGLLETLFVGSTSLQVALSAHTNVLVLRLPRAV